MYAAHLHRLQADFRPTHVLTFGSDRADQKRREALRNAGTRVIFALHNLHYLPHRPTACDVFLAPSHFLAQRYSKAWHEEVAVLPPALSTDTILAASHEPVFITWFNPEPAKGLWLMARIAERLGKERPDIPLLVVEGRGRAADLVAAGRAAGVDLSRYPNIMFNPPVARVADLWAACRVLLAPSVVEEAAGRVAMEAMLNGAVPIVSDRGGLPEMAGEAGIVLPLPASYTRSSRKPLPMNMAAPWFDAIARLVDDEAEFARRSTAARAAGAAWLPGQLGPVYARWFSGIVG
ncbi:MAG: glycosyltransferase [Gammaproteobacteria bacterium]